jgi:trk system potassium uptake protein TrkA
MLAQIAKEVFHVNKVIVRLYDPERQTVYAHSGIETICPSLLSSREIDKILVPLSQTPLASATSVAI